MSNRSDFPCPAIRTGTMKPVRSMADGNMYDDRNAYDASLKAQGLRIMEKGEKPSSPEPISPRQTIEKVMKQYV